MFVAGFLHDFASDSGRKPAAIDAWHMILKHQHHGFPGKSLKFDFPARRIGRDVYAIISGLARQQRRIAHRAAAEG